MAIAYVGSTEAYYRGRVSLVAPVIATSSLFAVTMAALLLRRSESVGRNVVFGALLVVGGAALVGVVR